ncbi:MAG: TetR/AcrR family transcriptional regulator [Collinsella sp.]|nr:TetR/AcrR family transcriptional regulator [Collinsella sp.]
MNKQPAVTEQTRANLRAAFWDLYAEKPIDKITVREITDRAGYNRATFYLYFRDVYDLFEQIEQEILDNVERLVNEGLMREETLDLSHHMNLIIALAQRYDGYLPQLMGPHGDPSFTQRLKRVLSPLLDRFILPESVLDGPQVEIMHEFYLSGVLAAVNTWMTMPERMPIECFVQLVIGAVLAGAETDGH